MGTASGLLRKLEGSRSRLVFRSAGEFFQEHRISWVALRALESRQRSLIKIVARKRQHILQKVEKNWGTVLGTSVSEQEPQRPRKTLGFQTPASKLRASVAPTH